MHIYVWQYIIHIVYLLRVSVSRVAIFREVHYEDQTYSNITEVLEQMHKHKILNFKNNGL